MRQERFDISDPIFQDPPQNEWVICRYEDSSGKIKEFSIPFTQEEFDAIVSARNHRDSVSFLGAKRSGLAREISGITIPQDRFLGIRTPAILNVNVGLGQADSIEHRYQTLRINPEEIELGLLALKGIQTNLNHFRVQKAA